MFESLLNKVEQTPTQVFYCDWFEIFKNTYFEGPLQTAPSENLSGAAVLIFRKYFGSNSLSAFYKILGVLKDTRREKAP